MINLLLLLLLLLYVNKSLSAIFSKSLHIKHINFSILTGLLNRHIFDKRNYRKTLLNRVVLLNSFNFRIMMLIYDLSNQTFRFRLVIKK